MKQRKWLSTHSQRRHARIQRGGGGGAGIITKNIEFHSNTDPDPLKITKLPSQHLILGHHCPAKSGIRILPPLIKKKIIIIIIIIKHDKVGPTLDPRMEAQSLRKSLVHGWLT